MGGNPLENERNAQSDRAVAKYKISDLEVRGGKA